MLEWLGGLAAAVVLLVAWYARRSNAPSYAEKYEHLQAGRPWVATRVEPARRQPSSGPPRESRGRKMSKREKDHVHVSMRRPRVDCGGTDCADLAVVGESYRQDVLQRIAADRLEAGETVVFKALIVPEPENPYDPHAIMVVADGHGLVGYFPREHAEEYGEVSRLLTQRGAVGECDAWLTGGSGNAASIGVMLHIEDADVLEDTLRSMLPLG